MATTLPTDASSIVVREYIGDAATENPAAIEIECVDAEPVQSITDTEAAEQWTAMAWTIVQESPTTTVIDGHWGFGFHVNAKAMALTIEKARTANVAACTVFRQSHVGRLAVQKQGRR